MGKKNKSFYKKNLKPFFADNSLLLTAIGGVAVGISLANILGSDKAKQIVDTMENSVKEFTNKMKANLTSEGHPDMDNKTRKRIEREQQPV